MTGITPALAFQRLKEKSLENANQRQTMADLENAR